MDINQLNQFCNNTLISHLKIEFVSFDGEKVVAQMPVEQHLMQPMGIMHGGASLALAETVGSAGSFLLVDMDKYTVVGLQISANHIASVKKGMVTATGKLLHKGNKTHLWDVTITGTDGKLVSTIRVTNYIKEIEN